MQSTLNFYLSNQKVQEPDNWQALSIELSFENNSPEAVLNAQKLIWKGINAKTINTWFLAGLSNGVGIFEGIPLRITICQTGEVVFNGIVDLTDPDTTWNCDIVTARIRDKRMDMVSELFQSITYPYLGTPVANGGAGLITKADFISVPYQVNNIPDYIEFTTTLIAIYEIVQQSVKIIDEIIGFSTAATVTVGGKIAALVELIFWCIEIIIMLAVVIDLIQAAAQNIIAPTYHKLCMNVNTLMSKACQYFGLGFSSTIMQSQPYSNLAIMPVKQAWANNKFDGNLIRNVFAVFNAFSANNRITYDDTYNINHGGFAYGYPDCTVAQLFQDMGEVFNAKAKIIFDPNGNPVLHFERWDYFYNITTYQLPNISDQAPFRQSYQTNANELSANYLVQYMTDSSDANTLNVYDGTSCSAQFQPIKVNTQNNVTLKHLTTRQIPFAQGLRKNRLTTSEQLLNGIFNVFGTIVNGIIDVINGVLKGLNWVIQLFGGNPITLIPYVSGNPFTSTLGILWMSNNITGVPKLLMLTGSSGEQKIDPSNRLSNDYIAARTLMKNFHFSSLALTTSPAAGYSYPYTPNTTYYNQYLLYKNQTIPICCKEYDIIKNNNVIKTYDNKFARVDSLKWNIFTGKAQIDYRVQQQYTTNLAVSYCIDGASYTQTL